MLRLTCLWTLCLLAFPLLLLQGFWTRRVTPKLPEAIGPGSAPEGDLHILGLGDSVIKGVGINRIEDSITPAFARSLSDRLYRSVGWTVSGRNGSTISDIMRDLPLLECRRVDMILISVGVNHVTNLTSLTRWHFQLIGLVLELKTRFNAPIVFLGLPPMGHFPALPQPLRFALGVRSGMLDLRLKSLAGSDSGIYWLQVGEELSLEMMADDGFHPSALACEHLADAGTSSLFEQGLRFNDSLRSSNP